MSRHIPATMATQHPDNASAPYWETDGDGFVSTREETEECYSSFRDLGCEEFMWDWEGKYVDEAVVDRLFHTYLDYFRKHQLGRDRFLTFRIPNIWHERGYSLARSMIGILTAESFAKDLGFHTPPLFEVILPFTSKAEDIMYIQDTFEKLAVFKHKLFKDGDSLTRLDVLPLFEGVDDLTSCRALLDRYVALHQRRFKAKPGYLRLHIARSDPALNAGLVPAVVAGKVALSEFARFSDEHGIPVHPAIGAGALPFRGSLSPERISDFLAEYPGVRTAYIQSAFRYDFPFETAKAAVHRLNKELPTTVPRHFAPRDIAAAEALIPLFSAPYRRSVEAIAPAINRLSADVPQRRERKLHTGLFGYSRGIGKKRLPRAIPFTASLYTLGVPPEFIGTGRGLEAARKAGIDVEPFYVNFRKDLMLAGAYLNRGNLRELAMHNKGWKGIETDVDLLEKLLGVSFGPGTKDARSHERIASSALRCFRAGKPLTEAILESGVLRRSLG